MREILFKGFCPSESGKQIITLDDKDIRGDWHYWDCFEGVSNLDAGFMLKETVSQYTGLKDKYGKRIWEGDMAANFGKVFKSCVKWDETRAGYAPFCNERTTFFADECSIIGDKFNTRSGE